MSRPLAAQTSGCPLADAGPSESQLLDGVLSESGSATGRLAVMPWWGRLRGVAGSGVAATGAMLFALKLAGCAFGLGMHLVLARLLGVSAYGTFATAFNAATLISLFASGGMPLTASRFLPRYLSLGERDLARGYLEIAAFATLAGGGLGAVILLAAAFALREDVTLALALAAASPLVLMLSLAQTATALLQALHRPLAAEVPILVLRPVLAVAACGIMALPALGLLDATTALAALVVASVIALAPTGLTIRRTLAPLDLPARGRRALRDWLPPGALLLLLVGGAALNERLDVMIVSAFVDPAEAGIYSVAARFGALISLGSAASTVRAMPLIAESLARQDRAAAARTAAQATRTALALAALSGIPLLLGAGLLLSLFGHGFASGATALRLLVAGHVGLAFGGAAATALIASGNERRIALVTGIGILINVALNLVLVPHFGMNGAAAATLVSLALTGLGLVVTARRHLGIGVLSGRDLWA